jgi:putative redox protein
MEASMIWNQGLSFSGSADSGFSLNLDAAAAAGGESHGFLPMELILLGLAGCTGMDVISILQKKRQTINGFEVRAKAKRASEHPRVFTHIDIEYVIRGKQVDPGAVERAIELSADRYCPAQAMLGKAVPIETHFTIVEEG